MENIVSNTIENSDTTRAIEVLADVAGSFTYASFQNAIPVIRSIAVNNSTAENFGGCELRLVSNPPFLRSKRWAVDRVAAGDRLSLADRKVELDPAYLAGLNESERGEIVFTLSAGDRTLAEIRSKVRLLARDEWGGVGDMAQLLPAFVMPNDPAVAKILRAAAERLAAHGHSSALDGYQSENPQRVFLLTAAIYSAVAGLSLHYAEPPASFEERGQKIRRPSTILTEGLATCLDTTLLFGAALEAAGLYPILLLFRGHAAVGVWLAKRTLSNIIEPDVMEIRKALASSEMIIFETTGVTNRPPMTLEQAQALVESRLDEVRRAEFVAAIDVRRSRSGGVTPLASHEPSHAVVDVIPAEPVELPLPPAPTMDEPPADIAIEKPTTAAGRIERWQKKLLDLTLRNRLLNFPDTKKTVPFLCTDISYLEDRLAAGASIRLISLPEQNPLGERDADLYRDIHGHDLQRRFATEALQRDELASALDAKHLEARLIDLDRQVRNDFAEGGANTLFLAVGFLRWKKKAEDERSYRAPLLLIPVKLDRKSASSRFNLRFHEDEPRFNATLLQFLEREFDLRLPQFAGELPRDEFGVDVPRLLSLMRQAVRDAPGMEVVDETALSTFSFAKFLMWKDLIERTEALRQNRVVKHLIDTPDQAFQADGEVFKDERELDRHYAPADIVSLLPADSSQIAASLAAAEGRDFVIVGPPGTGKSQTITNMIASCLAAGKTVLFVAEKTAALDVVYRRLREHGLGDRCLELHSSKTDRRSFLGQLKKSWESSSQFDQSGWVAINEKLRLRRDQLNAYVEALHRQHVNGLTPYAALGVALQGRERHAPPLSWPSTDTHDLATRLNLEEMAEEFGRVFKSVVNRPALDLVHVGEWSSQWQERLIGAAGDLKAKTSVLRGRLATFAARINLPAADDASFVDLQRLASFADALRDGAGVDHRVLFDREFRQLSAALTELEQAIRGYRAAEAGLTAAFDREVLLSIPVHELDNAWRQASASLWPMSWFGRRRVRKLLRSYAKSGAPDPETALRALRHMQTYAASVQRNRLAAKPVGFAGLDTDLAAVDRLLKSADRLLQGLLGLGKTAEELEAVGQAIAPTLRTPMGDPVRQAAQDYSDAFVVFMESARQFATISGRDPLNEETATLLSRLSAQLHELIEARHLLRDWSTWCGVRERAKAQGLCELVGGLQSGAVQPEESGAAFRLAYARWWVPSTLDADPVLREFRRFQHEHAIEEFRRIDDIVRAEAAHRVVKGLAHDLPPVQSVPRGSELGLLRHQMELQRPSRTIREMIAAMPSSFSKLAPCMLMSPLSIAQYLPPDHALFDVVIFDEASQITTWDAIGAIARARQTIIVGDPKQLPPTNFFGRNEDDEEVAEHERDLESILDEAKAAGIPVRALRWHYRSRNESLIAFSNHHYYQNGLITFPSSNVDDRAVQLRHVPDGVYDRGKSRTNRIEAFAVAAEAKRRMLHWLDLPRENRPTLGVITFNAQQQSLIQDLLDDARRDNPDLEWFFADERVEPTIVKNLENVQGDERDVILFSITFTQDAAGKRSMDFGALNRDGGERRLNVALTRARQELLVFSGFTADQIDASRTKAIGVNHLKTFLDFAARGPIALPAQDQGSKGPPESPFEEAVAAELDRLGWHITPQVGVSGFRVDIGIKHPERAGAYLAGVECDGATYHRSATARDRDKVREQVLRGLGWNILRVWSTDWWFDPKGAAERLHNALSALLEDWRHTSTDRSTSVETTHWDLGHEIEPSDQSVDEAEPSEDAEESPRPPGEEGEERVGGPDETISLAPAADAPLGVLREAQSGAPSSAAAALSEETSNRAHYKIADLSIVRAVPDRFHDLEYRSTLRAMVEAVVDCEAPLREDILAQRIARAHGWLRTGNKIRERVMLHLKDADRTSESSGDFIWKKGTVAELIDYRPPRDADARRAVSEISLAELASAVAANQDILEEPDPALALARLLGVERLAATARARLDEALDRARNYLSKPRGVEGG